VPRDSVCIMMCQDSSWKDGASKKPCLTAFRSYNAGMTHIVHDMDRPRSKLHKKEVAAGVSVLEAPPEVVDCFAGYVETPRGLRALTSVWAVVRMGVWRSCGLTDGKDLGGDWCMKAGFSKVYWGDPG